MFAPHSDVPSSDATAPARTLRLGGAWWLVALVALTGCEGDEPDGPAGIDAGSLDGGPAQAGALDARVPGLDATTCYSPLRVPEPGLASVLVNRLPGCPCVQPKDPIGYCLHGYAVRCYSNGWGFGADGNCSSPREAPAPGSCQRSGGTLIGVAASCPDGFDTRARYAGDAGTGELAPCCLPIEVSSEDCRAAGLSLLPGPAANRLEARCPEASRLRAFVVGEGAPLLCCAP